MINHDCGTMVAISIAIPVDDYRLVPVGAISISVDDDGLVAVAVVISISVNDYAIGSYTNTSSSASTGLVPKTAATTHATIVGRIMRILLR